MMLISLMYYAFSQHFHTQINTSTTHIHFSIILLPSPCPPSRSHPSSLFLLLHDNESIMCAAHSQLSDTQMRDEVDRSCHGSPQIECCIALLLTNCHKFFMLNSILNNLYSYASSTQRCLSLHLHLHINMISTIKWQRKMRLHDYSSMDL